MNGRKRQKKNRKAEEQNERLKMKRGKSKRTHKE